MFELVSLQGGLHTLRDLETGETFHPVVGPMADSLGPALRPAATMLAGAAVTAGAALWLSRRFNGRFRGPFSAGRRA